MRSSEYVKERDKKVLDFDNKILELRYSVSEEQLIELRKILADVASLSYTAGIAIAKEIYTGKEL